MNAFIALFKPFEEIYGWSPNIDKRGYKECMFNVLFKLLNKVKENDDNERQINEVFKAAFYRGFARNQAQPIDRAINELVGQIQGTIVKENGIDRFKYTF